MEKEKLSCGAHTEILQRRKVQPNTELQEEEILIHKLTLSNGTDFCT